MFVNVKLKNLGEQFLGKQQLGTVLVRGLVVKLMLPDVVPLCQCRDQNLCSPTVSGNYICATAAQKY